MIALALWVRLALRDRAAQGVEAYREGKYAQALEHFRQAAQQDDPGRIAQGQAAALYRLQRYEEAKERYHCAEETGGDLRAARAAYDSGNCSLREACQKPGAPNTELLLRAAGEYRKCLSLEPATGGAAQLFEDARHNLELTRLLLARNPAGPPAKSGGQEQVAKTQKEKEQAKEELCPE
jgi:tetratricopeptide (TPR) repeat protein